MPNRKPTPQGTAATYQQRRGEARKFVRKGAGSSAATLLAGGWRVLAVDRGADDPRVPYAMATAADLDVMVAARVGIPALLRRPEPRGARALIPGGQIEPGAFTPR